MPPNRLEVLTLEIAHDYYASGRCSACRLAPSAETARLLKQAGAVLRLPEGGLRVAAPSADVLGDRLTFDVSVSDPYLAAFTEADPVLSPEIADFTVAPQSSGHWATVVILAQAGGPLPVAATIGFSSRQVRWRWIFVPGGQTGSMDGWTVRRDGAPGTPVDQDPPEAIQRVDGSQAWQITLRDPLPLREHPPASQAFTLIPPPGAAASSPIRLPAPAPADLHQTGTGELIAEMFVSL